MKIYQRRHRAMERERARMMWMSRHPADEKQLLFPDPGQGAYMKLRMRVLKQIDEEVFESLVAFQPARTIQVAEAIRRPVIVVETREDLVNTTFDGWRVANQRLSSLMIDLKNQHWIEMHDSR